MPFKQGHAISSPCRTHKKGECTPPSSLLRLLLRGVSHILRGFVGEHEGAVFGTHNLGMAFFLGLLLFFLPKWHGNGVCFKYAKDPLRIAFYST